MLQQHLPPQICSVLYSKKSNCFSFMSSSTSATYLKQYILRVLRYLIFSSNLEIHTNSMNIRNSRWWEIVINNKIYTFEINTSCH